MTYAVEKPSFVKRPDDPAALTSNQSHEEGVMIGECVNYDGPGLLVLLPLPTCLSCDILATMKHLTALALITLAALQAWAGGGSWSGLCLGIPNGDTVTVLQGLQPVKIRLHGIDCPELGQPFGTKARQFTASLVFDQKVTIEPRGTDRDGLTVAWVYLNGMNINYELVKVGMAWWDRTYAPNDRTLESLEGEARAARRGLWSDPNPVPPWGWKAQKKNPKK